MSKKRSIEHEAMKYEIVESLERAIDRLYLRLLKTAQRHWERGIARRHPSDKCVSVRIRTAPAKKRSVPGAGFLKAGKVTLKDRAKRALPHFAH